MRLPFVIHLVAFIHTFGCLLTYIQLPLACEILCRSSCQTRSKKIFKKIYINILKSSFVHTYMRLPLANKKEADIVRFSVSLIVFITQSCIYFIIIKIISALALQFESQQSK